MDKVLQSLDKVLQSLIITHGFFDIYHTKPNLIIIDLILYLFSIFINTLFLYIFPIFSILLFVLLSSFHFSQDFKYLKFYNYNIYGSLILITTLTDINKVYYWINTIDKIIFINITSYILLFLFFIILFLKILKNKNNFIEFKKIKKLDISIFTITLILFNYMIKSPYKFILYYLGFFHSPLAIIRKSDIYGYNILKYWLCLSIIFYYLLVKFDTEILLIEKSYYFSLFSKIIISILNTHIIFTYIEYRFT